MQIDSVRELKARLADETVTPAKEQIVASSVAVRSVAPKAARSAVNVAAQSIKAVDPVQRLVALGITKKSKNNYRLAVRLQRRALMGHDYVERIRKAAKGEVDVRYVGRISKRAVPWYQTRQRPIRPGISIGHFLITAGTLGCFVRDANGDLQILSNNHVLANENHAKKGDSIIQPGDFDGGANPADRVGLLGKFVRLKKTKVNLVDAALATIEAGIKTNLNIKGIGNVKGLFAGEVLDGMSVKKLGRTTGLTRGRVTAFEIDNVVVAYDIGNIRFDDQIEIEGVGNSPFSDGGDSGSLIVTGPASNVQGVALLFAGGDQGGTNGLGLTYGNPLGTVLQALGVTLA